MNLREFSRRAAAREGGRRRPAGSRIWERALVSAGDSVTGGRPSWTAVLNVVFHGEYRGHISRCGIVSGDVQKGHSDRTSGMGTAGNSLLRHRTSVGRRGYSPDVSLCQSRWRLAGRS